MKILYISTLPFQYNSSATLQNLSLIKGFLNLGHDVHALNVRPISDSQLFDRTMFENLEIPIHYIDYPVLYNAFAAKKTTNKFKKFFKENSKKIYYKWNVYDSFSSIVNNVKDIPFKDIYFDLIISSSDPRSSHLLAEKITHLYPQGYGKWIQYWGDPMYIDITRKPLLPWRVKLEEQRIISLADKVFYVSPLTADFQKNLYKKYANKIGFVPLAYEQIRLYGRNNTENPFLGYYGSYHFFARNIMPLYNAARKFNIRLEIIGDSDINLQSYEDLNIEKRLSYNEILYKEKNADILVCLCNKHGTQIPGKIYYYSATDKPILIINDGNMANNIRNYLEPYNRFVFCNNNADDIAKAVSDIVEGRINVKNEPVQQFFSSNVASMMLEQLREE